VFATGKGDAPGAAGIATIPWDGSSWGQPTVVVPSTNKMVSNLFPMHSHDGKWIAFSRGKGGHGDLTAQLFVMGAKNGTPVELVKANRVVSNQMTDGQHQNSQPTWAPAGDFQWVAFNSKREYGLVLPKGTQQIWVAAIDPAKLGGSEDPSFPAFRLQFQGLEEDNHRAYWTLDVRDTTPPPPPPPRPDAGMCVATGMKCDPVADTCCERGVRCDSQDDGVTYTCMPPLIP
jgi:Tol biopolymer transport system component